jgi:hypothetical protein
LAQFLDRLVDKLRVMGVAKIFNWDDLVFDKDPQFPDERSELGRCSCGAHRV